MSGFRLLRSVAFHLARGALALVTLGCAVFTGIFGYLTVVFILACREETASGWCLFGVAMALLFLIPSALGLLFFGGLTLAAWSGGALRVAALSFVLLVIAAVVATLGASGTENWALLVALFLGLPVGVAVYACIRSWQRSKAEPPGPSPRSPPPPHA
jgi:hypothetical protein